MAASVVTTFIGDHNAVGKWALTGGSLSIAAGDYPTGGLTVDFSSAEIKSSMAPVWVEVLGKSGYIYRYIKGATKNVGTLMIFQANGTNSPLTELSAAATPAGVVADTVEFIAYFPLLR